MTVYSSIIHNSQKVEIIQMSTTWWMDIYVNPCNEILLESRKEWDMDTHYSLKETWKYQMTGAWYKMPHIIWVHLYDLSRTSKSVKIEYRLVFA